ncbi:hypothetical protein CEQ90_20280 [Lewinellaceae bacterium SD302]|nr:hypothetical protein CEQ90_20280 [Lewinellaceae bacterium SD302]
MLLRLYIDNFTSFSKDVELNTFPNRGLDKHKNHVYEVAGISVLKLISIYGANASGKSNMIKALSYLKSLVLDEELPDVSYVEKFALASANLEKPFKIAVEYISEGIGFIYGVEISDDEILCEELYKSGLGISEDELIFRKTIENNSAKIKFFDSFYESERNEILLSVIEESLLKKNKPVFKFLTTIKGTNLQDILKAFYWFDNTLRIIRPKESAFGLPYHLSKDKLLWKFANNVMKAYHVGIEKLVLEKFTAEEFFGMDDSSIISELKSNLNKSENEFVTLRSENGNDEICVVEENNELFVLQLKIKHYSKDIEEPFNVDNESDGTKRLLDFIPAFYISLKHPAVFCVDEIGQSIHPILIKKLIEKFSFDDETAGQIIFTTHESNLLDQEILRRDEIWFTEKEKYGGTSLYSLNSFKEHNTKNIRKGYLNGRYGAIPFLGNLEDLNWHADDLI